MNTFTWFRSLFGKRSPQPEGLISVLLDRAAPEGDRDDAAMDLGQFDDPGAEAALREVASDPTTPEVIADSCGESLAGIWLRQGRTEARLLEGLTAPARAIASAMLHGAK